MRLVVTALALIALTPAIGESFLSRRLLSISKEHPLENKRDAKGLTTMTSVNTGTLAKQQAIIVGGGPAGALMAVFLAQDGRFQVELFEGREEDQIAGPTVRSYNVVFMQRGLDALKTAGIDLAEVAAEFNKTVISITGNVRHHVSPEPNRAIFKGSYSMCRGDATIALLQKARSLEDVEVHFGCNLTAVDLEQRIATFQGSDGEIINRGYDMLVGADGVNSKVRSELVAKVPDFTVIKKEDSMAFKTIPLPIMGWQGATEQWKTCFHTYNCKIGCALAPPRGDEDVTTIINLQAEGEQSFDSLMKTPQDVKDFFANNYPIICGEEGLSEEQAKNFLNLGPVRLTSTYCSRLNHENVVLLGDAAHSMLASLGQGVQAALEDCKVLSCVLRESSTSASVKVDIPAALETYNVRRHEDVIAVCTVSELGMGGGRSMRPGFIAQMMVTMTLNKTLGRLLPKVFMRPSLTRISKSDTSYGEILRNMKREERIFKVVVGVAIGATAFAARFFWLVPLNRILEVSLNRLRCRMTQWWS